MKTLISQALRYEGNQLLVLDQSKLPFEQIWLLCHSPDEMVLMIQRLAVRGAPLIGVAAALSLAHYVEQGATDEEIRIAANQLERARPTAVNLSYCIRRLMREYGKARDQQAIVLEAEKIFEEDAQLSEKISQEGASLIQDGESILTHCNAGGLVTTGPGTALGVILRAHHQGKALHVYVDETRPLLQGGRLTAWELASHGVPYTLICDNMAASLMLQGKIQRVITGADRIAANGDTANKIGTYSIAALAFMHQIPFHIAAPVTTFDFNCASGAEIHIEERSQDEVRGYADFRWALPDAVCYNPAFDVTPARYISSFITEIGVLNSSAAFTRLRQEQIKHQETALLVE